MPNERSLKMENRKIMSLWPTNKKRYDDSWQRIFGCQYKQIPLNNNNNKFILVDEDDFDAVSKYIWTYHKISNREEAVTQDKTTKKQIKIHRMILNLIASDKVFVDHINHNGLDNRKCNLRICSNKQNQANQLVKAGGSSIYKGVRYNHGKWEASIGDNGNYVYIGSFDNELDAAKAYDQKAVELNGEFALINFPNARRCPTCGSCGYIKKEFTCGICLDKGFHLDWSPTEKRFIETVCLYCGSGKKKI
jgi:hypothetical protein